MISKIIQIAPTLQTKIIKLVERFYNKSPKIRRFLMKLIYNNKNKEIELFQKTFLVNSLRENGYYRASNMSLTSSLLRDEVAILFNLCFLIDDRDCFIDIGANIGLFSIVISSYQNILPNFEVHAFEANPNTFVRLKNNGKRYNFHCYQIAISNHSGELEFCDGAVSHVFTTTENISSYNIPEDICKIKCERLDSFQFKSNSLIFKIDVEGQELEVLQGAIDFFEREMVKAVYLDGFANNDVLKFLKEYGFCFWDGRNLANCDGQVFSLLATSPKKVNWQK
jgi:FkbM family methyltransferase